MATFEELHNASGKYIRKTLGGFIMVADMSVEMPKNLMAGPDEMVDYKSLGFVSLGYVSKGDGINFTRDQEQSETESFGAQDPTRIDFTKDTTSAAFRCQATTKKVMEMYLNKKIDSVVDSNGELQFDSDRQPDINYYRMIFISKDGNGNQAKYIAKFMPRAIVSETQENAWNPENELSYGLTVKATYDEEAGYAVRHILAGSGFTDLWEGMGFSQ